MKISFVPWLLTVGLFLTPGPIMGQKDRQWVVTQNGSIVQIAYGSDTDFPQYAALYLDSSFFRLNYGPRSTWGTSCVLFPAFWNRPDFSGDTYINFDDFFLFAAAFGSDNLQYDLDENKRVDLEDFFLFATVFGERAYVQGATVTASWRTDGPDLVLSFSGSRSGINARGKVRITPPGSDSIAITVAIETSGVVALAKRPGEAFKPVMLSSMRVSPDSLDTQSAHVGVQSFSIPGEGWIISLPVDGNVFGLKGGTSIWKTNAPTIVVTMDQARQVTGWVTPSRNPNDDNVGFWAVSDKILSTWSYTITAKP